MVALLGNATWQSIPILGRRGPHRVARQAHGAPGHLLGDSYSALGHQLDQRGLVSRGLSQERLPDLVDRLPNQIGDAPIAPFAQSHHTEERGARSSTDLYSLMETAKANDIEPWRYRNRNLVRLRRIRTPVKSRPSTIRRPVQGSGTGIHTANANAGS